MELTQLKQFKEIAECQNITKAAGNLFVSQPALSKAMKNLEDELQVKLFDRTKNSILLNHHGKTVLKHVLNILDELNVMRSELNNSTQYLADEIRFSSPDNSPFRHILPLFNQDHPEVRTTTILNTNERIENLLLNDQCDIAFVFEPIKNKRIFHIPLGEERMLLRVPSTHQLAKRNEINIKELDKLTILALNDSEYITNFLENFQKKYAIKINFYYQNDPLLYNSILKNGRHISISSTLEREHLNDDESVKYLRILGSEEFTTVVYYISYLQLKEYYLLPFLKWIRNNFKSILTLPNATSY